MLMGVPSASESPKFGKSKRQDAPPLRGRFKLFGKPAFTRKVAVNAHQRAARARLLIGDADAVKVHALRANVSDHVLSSMASGSGEEAPHQVRHLLRALDGRGVTCSFE